MKRCPTCQRTYTDETVKFCRVDGVTLVNASAELSEFLGYGYAISGKGAAALAILKELQEKYQKHEALAQDVAAIYAGLGDKDQAFAWLEKDFESSSGQLARARWELPFESLYSDPRFADLLRRMGLRSDFRVQ